MRKGDVVIAAERGAFSGKPRPWVVVQADSFLDDVSSVTVCPIVDSVQQTSFRVTCAPSQENGLRKASAVLVDKVTTIRSSSLRATIGSLSRAKVSEIDQALRLWLDL